MVALVVAPLTTENSMKVLRERLGLIREQRFDGNLSAMARAFGVTPAYLSDVLAQKRGVGMKIIQALAKHTGESVDDLLHGRATVPNDPYPARAEALRIVESAIRTVREADVPDAAGRSVDWWLLRLRDAEAQVRAAEPPKAVAPVAPLRSTTRPLRR